MQNTAMRDALVAKGVVAPAVTVEPTVVVPTVVKESKPSKDRYVKKPARSIVGVCDRIAVALETKGGMVGGEVAPNLIDYTTSGLIRKHTSAIDSESCGWSLQTGRFIINSIYPNTIISFNGINLNNSIISLTELLDNTDEVNAKVMLRIISYLSEYVTVENSIANLGILRMDIPSVMTKSSLRSDKENKRKGSLNITVIPSYAMDDTNAMIRKFHLSANVNKLDILTDMPMINNVLSLLGMMLGSVSGSTYVGYSLDVIGGYVHRPRLNQVPAMITNSRVTGLVVGKVTVDNLYGANTVATTRDLFSRVAMTQ